VVVDWGVLICLSGRGSSVILSSRFALIHGKNPLLPLLSGAQTVDTIITSLVLNVAELAGNMAEKFKVFGEGLDTLEASENVQGNEALRIHLLTEEHVLAHVVNREVVLKLHGEHVEEREWLHVRLVRDSAHGRRVDWWIAIHRVDVTWERINTINISGVRQRGRSEGHTVSLLRAIGHNVLVRTLTVIEAERLRSDEGVVRHSGVTKLGVLAAKVRVRATATVGSAASTLRTELAALTVELVESGRVGRL
jgi:hypothetical protein